MNEFVFVYGTLKQGGGLHNLLLGSKCVGKYKLEFAKLIDTGAGYPGLVFTPEVPENFVYGEVYKITPIVLARLDHAEGYPHLYTRNQSSVQGECGGRRLAWVYVYQRATGKEPTVKGGMWKV